MDQLISQFKTTKQFQDKYKEILHYLQPQQQYLQSQLLDVIKNRAETLSNPKLHQFVRLQSIVFINETITQEIDKDQSLNLDAVAVFLYPHLDYMMNENRANTVQALCKIIATLVTKAPEATFKIQARYIQYLFDQMHVEQAKVSLMQIFQQTILSLETFKLLLPNLFNNNVIDMQLKENFLDTILTQLMNTMQFSFIVDILPDIDQNISSNQLFVQSIMNRMKMYISQFQVEQNQPLVSKFNNQYSAQQQPQFQQQIAQPWSNNQLEQQYPRNQTQQFMDQNNTLNFQVDQFKNDTTLVNAQTIQNNQDVGGNQFNTTGQFRELQAQNQHQQFQNKQLHIQQQSQNPFQQQRQEQNGKQLDINDLGNLLQSCNGDITDNNKTFQLLRQAENLIQKSANRPGQYTQDFGQIQQTNVIGNSDQQQLIEENKQLKNKLAEYQLTLQQLQDRDTAIDPTIQQLQLDLAQSQNCFDQLMIKYEASRQRERSLIEKLQQSNTQILQFKSLFQEANEKYETMRRSIQQMSSNGEDTAQLKAKIQKLQQTNDALNRDKADLSNIIRKLISKVRSTQGGPSVMQ